MCIVNGVSGASLHCINFGVAMDQTDNIGNDFLYEDDFVDPLA